MRMVWIWAVLTWSCHQQDKGSTVAPEVVDDTDDPSHEGSDGSPDVDSGGTESSDSGEVQASDSGEVEPSDSGSPPLWPGSTEADRQAMVDSMVAAAQNFLASLDDSQRGQVQYGLDDAERSDWSNLPHAVYIRQGVSFGELNEERMALGWELIRVSLSAAGLQRAQDIVQMESLLWDDGDVNAFPGNFFFTFFDTPSSDAPWGWQLDGHHLALNFTVVGSEVTMTPSLWGTSPKTWLSGDYAGLTPMADEENKAFEWMANLNGEQLSLAQLSAEADPALMAGPTAPQEAWPEPQGIPVSALDTEQRAALLDWIAVYVGNLAEPQFFERMAEIEEHLDDVSVAWMGSTEPGSMMYYRIQGSRMLIEFDHTRSADHIHAVYRDPVNDYGGDWLRKHLHDHHAGE
jgi:hypothetical protein